jgi:TatD DNase family protein
MEQYTASVEMKKPVFSTRLEFADAHCHLNLFNDAKKVMMDSRDMGVSTIITAGGCRKDNRENAELASIDGIFAVVGVSPDFSSSDSAEVETLEKLVKSSRKIVGIGEIGIDVKVAKGNGLELQEEVFARQVRIAKDMGLPVVLHSRGALDKVMGVLDRECMRGAMFHFFEGDAKQAVDIAAKGHFISIPPAETGKRKKVIKAVGLDSIVVETDSPIVGKTPTDVIKVCEMIALIKGVGVEDVAARTTENIRRLFFI